MRTEKATFTNMCMVYDGENILVENRCKTTWRGISFPGGHVEPNESFVDSVIREVKEETGLTIKNPQLCGIKQFTTADTGRYVVLFFKTNQYEGELQSSSEGEVFWLDKNELPAQKLAPDFLEMYHVFTGEQSEFFYFEEAGIWKSSLK